MSESVRDTNKSLITTSVDPNFTKSDNTQSLFLIILIFVTVKKPLVVM